MRTAFIVLAAAGLFLTLSGPLLLFAGAVSHDVARHVMTAGMVCWFAGSIPRGASENRGT